MIEAHELTKRCGVAGETSHSRAAVPFDRSGVESGLDLFRHCQQRGVLTG